MNNHLIRLAGSAFFILTFLAGCSGVGASFRATDPSFNALPSKNAPPVFLRAENAPKVPLRSVGVIVVVYNTGDMAGASRAAASKGQELGCWAVLEHRAFEGMQKQAALSPPRRLDVVFAHGGAHAAPAPQGQSGASQGAGMDNSQMITTATLEFDCLFKHENEAPADLTS